MSGGNGGGIYEFTNATLNLSSSIVAKNMAATSPDIRGAVASADYNLIKNTAGIIGPLPGTNITGVDPMLGPLAYYAGPTLTHILPALTPKAPPRSPSRSATRRAARPRARRP